jgi:MFS transporter, OFA family, oxalate/formate antiporter
VVSDVPPDRLATLLKMDGSYPTPGGPQAYHAHAIPTGFSLMFLAGMLSGLLGIGSGAIKVLAMDQAMRLPFKVSTTTSNFMIGVMATAQLGPIARDFKVANIPVNLFGLTMAALPFALSLDRIMNGITRPLFGWISDHLGRENTMALAFGLEGLAILGLISLAHISEMFVILSGLAFFAWGEIFSLFPAASGDLFGQQFATTNYGLLYTAKGTAALLVPIGSLFASRTGNWLPVFMLAIAFDWIAGLLAFLVLKPLRIRWLSAQSAEAQAPSKAA